MLMLGEVDFILLVLVDIVKWVNEEEGLSVYVVFFWKNFQFFINIQKYFIDNKKFCQVFKYFWDYDSVVNQVYDGYVLVGEGLILKIMWGYNDDLNIVQFDL